MSDLNYNVPEKKELRNLSKVLQHYKDQLIARHESDPSKSPPLFLLTFVIARLKSLGSKK